MLTEIHSPFNKFISLYWELLWHEGQNNKIDTNKKFHIIYDVIGKWFCNFCMCTHKWEQQRVENIKSKGEPDCTEKERNIINFS